MPATVEALLSQPDRWESLSERAISTARAEDAWAPFVSRVSQALEDLPEPDPSSGARGALGERLREQLAVLIPLVGESRHRAAELEAELPRVTARNEELEAELARVAARKQDAETELAQVRGELERWRRRGTSRWRRRPREALRRLRRRLD
jgi:septal ring factor EnvC (AmiA/AmiB activator)